MERERHLKNLKIISKLAKNKKNNLKQKLNLGKNLMKSMQGMGCYPEKFLYLPNNKPISLSIEDSLSKSIGTVKIGQGRFGEVYLGCIDKECKKKVAIKAVLNEDITHEYKISKRLSSYGVVKSFTIQKCKNVMFMYSEYANNGTLKSFLRNNKTNLLPIHFRTIITQILYNLYRIQKKYPTFRHHDLHTENILINTTSPSRVRLFKVNNSTLKVHDIGLQALISDFGLSTMKGLKNPEVDDDPELQYKTSSGIYRNSHNMYDIQYILNIMRQEIKVSGTKSGIEAVQFIERVIPSEYLGKESSKIKNFRLRASPLGHPQLPTFKQIFNDRYFSPYKKSVVPFDISTIIKRNKVSVPKPIIVKHGGGLIKKTFNNIRKELALKNVKKNIKRPSIRPRIIPKKVNVIKPSVKVSVANKGYLKIDNRKCISYKKQGLINKAKNLGIDPGSKTIKKLCEDIKLKYIK